MQTEFTIATCGPGLYEFTFEVARWVQGTGVLTLFVRHSSCSLLVQENADPDMRADLQDFLERLAPPADHPSMRWLRHVAEGPDDMPAHIRAALLPVSLSIPVTQGRMALGTWQGLYLVEHREAPRSRRVAAHLSR
ncbi:MAG: secondary thiamine-phosphate synthase enzyme YjbQ [Paracoccaceae bacterium]